MSNPYSITMYEPIPANWSRDDELQASIDFRIDPSVYKRMVLEEWPLAEPWGGTDAFPFSCGLYSRSSDGIRWARGEAQLYRDFQTVVMRHPPLEFIFWHRTFVPSKYRLFLSSDASEDYVELLPDVTLEQMADQVGFGPFREPRVIFHITTHDEWVEHIKLRLEKSESWRTYHSAAFNRDGFIQCATAQQVRDFANTFHKGQSGLVLMWIEQDRLQSQVSLEEISGILSRDGESFPRIVGPLNGEAIMRVVPYEPEPDGTFPWPVDIVDVS